MDNCQDKPTLFPEALWKALMNLPALRYMKAPVDTVAQLYEKYPIGNEKGTFAFVHNENTFYTYHPRGWSRGEWKPISADGVSTFFEIDAEFLKDGDILVYDSNKKKFVVKSGNVWNNLLDKTISFFQVSKFLNEVDEIPTLDSEFGVYFIHKDESVESITIEHRALYLVLNTILGKKIIKIWNSSDYYTAKDTQEKLDKKANQTQVDDIAASVDILAVTKVDNDRFEALMNGVIKQESVDTYNTGSNSLATIYGLTPTNNGANGKAKQNGWDVLVRHDETKGGISNRYNWNGSIWVDMETGNYPEDVALLGGSSKNLFQVDTEAQGRLNAILTSSINKFNKNGLTKGKYISFHAGGINGITEHENSAIFYFYNIKPNSDYILSGIYKGYTNTIAFLDATGAIIGGIPPAASTANLTFTTPALCSDIAMTVYFNQTTDLEKYYDKLQLEEGTVATTYVPYVAYRDIYNKPEVDAKLSTYDDSISQNTKWREAVANGWTDKKYPIKAQKGYWHLDTGEYVSDGYYYCGEYFIEGNEQLFYSGIIQWVPFAATYMDKEGNMIGRELKQNTSTPITYDRQPLFPPKGTHSVRLCGVLKNENFLHVMKPNNGSILWGKKWAVCGDSITSASDKTHISSDPLTGEQLGYAERIGRRNHMEYYNYGVGGGYLSYKPGHYYCFSNSDEDAAYAKPTYKQLPDDLDYITIWFGINDSWYTGSQNDAKVGDIDSTDNTTFYGAYNIVLDYLIRKYPNTKTGVVVTHGATAKYRKAIRDIAKKWGVGCIDLIDGSMPLWVESDNALIDPGIVAFRRQQFTYDGQHPNDAGYESVYPLCESKMINW